MATVNILTTVGTDDGTDDGTTFSSGFDGVLVGQAFDIAQDGWLRFQSVPIAQGTQIDSAYLTLMAINDAAEFAAGTILSNIYGIAEDDHVAPTSHATWATDHGIHTTAVVTWDFTTASSGVFITAKITSIIQEIVNRAGWASGNDIGIHIDDDGTANPTSFEFAAFEDALQAPMLTIITADTFGGGSYGAMGEFGMSDIGKQPAVAAANIPEIVFYYRQQRRKSFI